ncbi:MAG TPA: cell division protein ZipA [Porticoccaceae bacterium]|nr:cell division protein ZipA [Porticoccaceae bacterium]
MELGGREILIALGGLLILGIFLDGFRRTRAPGSGKIRMSRKQPIFGDEDFDDTLGELPTGQARVVQVRDKESVEQLNHTLRESAARNENKLTAPFRAPQQTDLNLDPEPTPEIEPGPANSRSPSANACETPLVGGAASTPDVGDVLALHLMAPRGEKFSGSELLDVVLKQGLRYGDKKVFHRHQFDDGTGEVLFSMTNAVNPGTFDLDSMEAFSTPGISFFMVMQDADDPMVNFEMMLETVDKIKRELGGELKDEQRSAMTRQTAEHYRQRIMDFNRKQLAGT